MSNSQFPTSPLEIERWANQENISTLEAGRKYIQYLILVAICRHNKLRASMVFKGGNALEFIYLPNRSTTDLDFSFIESVDDPAQLLGTIRSQLEMAVSVVNDGYGTAMRVQSIRQNPARPDAHFPTFSANIGFALPDQNRQKTRLLSGEPVANVIPVEMTVNEVVCDWSIEKLGFGNDSIQVSTLNDIVAEKLRAILQQKVRKRYRKQDILDIAMICGTRRGSLDTKLIGEFLVRKSEARGINATKLSFQDEEIRRRSSTSYADLANTSRHTFIPFEEAWGTVITLVESLNIPD